MIGLFFTLIIILVMSGILGLAFTLMGCVNTPNCIAYASFKKVSIIGHEVKEDRCDNCNPPRSSCRNYLKQCFHSYAIAEFKADGQTKTCLVPVAKGYDYSDQALREAQRVYKQGNEYRVPVHRGNWSCESPEDLVWALPGFVLLGIFVLTLLVFIVLCRINWNKEVRPGEKEANKPQNGNKNTNSNARPEMPEALETTVIPENDI